MKKYLIIAIALIIGVSISSCKKLLEEDPKSLISNSNYYKTSADALSAINGVYAATRADVRGNIDPIWIAESASDDVTAGGTPVPARLEIENLTYNSQGTWISTTWRTAYNVINRANNVIAYVDSATVPAILVRRVHAEAKFLRAFYYTRLAQYYGDVPLLTAPTSNENLYPKRTPIKDVYAQIISDLQYAEVNLDTKYAYADAVNGGRATKGAAKTLLGYVYLVMAGYPLNDVAKYQSAVDKLNEVIANKSAYGYELMPSYAAIFNVATKASNTEAIFSYRGTAGLPANVNAGTSMTYWFYSFTSLLPTTEVVNTLFETTDARKAASLGKKGTTNVCVKYLDGSNITPETNNDFHILRYADVLMMKAEALMEIGGTDNLNTALALVNQIRTAHGGASLPLLTYTDQDNLRQKIRLERRREFIFEGKRWFDLVRWNIFVPTMRANMAAQYNQPIASYDYITKNQMLLPIPYADIVANTNLRPQNPGY